MKRFSIISISVVLSVILLYLFPSPSLSQSLELNDELKRLVSEYKKDDRGPFQAIRWFCPDGSTVSPPARCPQSGGIMHALHKDRVTEIAREFNIHLGQILAGTPVGLFWDDLYQQSRLKQFLLEKYLQSIDDGWILRRARFYRGAFQAEDEEKWGKGFLIDRLGSDALLNSHFFLLRQSAKGIPHLDANDKRWENIRSLSRLISDEFPAFFNLRVKLHGLPEPFDLPAVKAFKALHKDKLNERLTGLTDELIVNLESAYQPVNLQMLTSFLNRLPDAPAAIVSSVKKLASAGSTVAAPVLDGYIADLMWEIRTHLSVPAKSSSRLALLDLSILLEKILFTRVSVSHPEAVGPLLERFYILAKAAAACGFLELWEWESAEPMLRPPGTLPELSPEELVRKIDYCRRIVEWGAGMVRAEFYDTVNLFAGFEPLAHGFIDDRVRSSLLLPLGNTAARLLDIAAEMTDSPNIVMNIRNRNRVRGLNPGFALGELTVVRGIPRGIEWSPQKIYVLEHAPADIKPVAGIMTVSAGNLVSHVQLLSRNLGIPNAIVSIMNFNELQAFSGRTVFYAVSPGGVVILKPAESMTDVEKALVEEKKRPSEKVTVSTGRIDWKAGFKRLSQLRASDSGRICGPKAANLGQLKFLYPDLVVEGLVIPFAVFRDHMNQRIPGRDLTYWEFLSLIFSTAASDRAAGKDVLVVENTVLEQLAILKEAIQSIPFLPGFVPALQREFAAAFGAPMGTVPVFLRSDTNMEDLKDFTGAGLNLTVFNVPETDKILQGIRDVWASPYSSRSFLWRQKYLTNPENVFPSILLMPSVNVDKSGVMVTAGVLSSRADDITAAFSRGVAGAVDGQAAEVYVISPDFGPVLLSPARETKFTSLPVSGGIVKSACRLERGILSSSDLHKLRLLAEDIEKRLTVSPGNTGPHAFDIELGFLGSRIYLFQVRPFAENKKAKSSIYLKSLDKKNWRF